MTCDPSTLRFETVNGVGPWCLHLYALRENCLRSNTQGPGELPGDDQSTTAHVLAWCGPLLIGAGTLVLDPAPFNPSVQHRLRALAVRPEWRGKGIGRELTLRRLQLCAPAPAWSAVRVGTSERLHTGIGAHRIGEPYPGDASWWSGQVVAVLHSGSLSQQS